MSKAFTRESDDLPEDPIGSARSMTPPGAASYLTPDGAQRFREELQQLMQRRAELPSGDRSETGAELRKIEARIRQLTEILRTATVVESPAGKQDQVGFGAFVTVRDSQGEETVYRLVGPAEIDLDKGWISSVSPLAKALLGHRTGDWIEFKSPAGPQQFEIIKVEW